MKDSIWKELVHPSSLIAMVVAGIAFGYVFVQLDIIPDVIPVIGYADDAIIALGAFIGVLKIVNVLNKWSKKR